MTDSVIRSSQYQSFTTVVPFPIAEAVPPLDTYTDVAFAYSFRKLRTAYAGSAVKIERVSDNAQADIGFVGNNFDTAAAAAHIGGSTGYIQTWYDQSGNGTNITQTTATTKLPLYSATAFNSLPGMIFDGSDDRLQVDISQAAFGSGTNYTYFCALNQDGTNSQNVILSWVRADDAAGIKFFCTYSDDKLYNRFGSDNASTGDLAVAQPVGWDDTNHVVEYYRDSGDVAGIVVDGVSLTTGSGRVDDLYTATVTMDVGCYHQFGGFIGFFFKGRMSEVMFFNNDIGSTGRTAVRANIPGILRHIEMSDSILLSYQRYPSDIQVPFAVPVPPLPALDVTFIARTDDSSDASTYTFSSQSFGTADTNRKIYVVAHCGGGATSQTITSATIGGISATVHRTQTDDNGQTRTATIFSADVPTGTTGSIVINWGSSTSRTTIGVYRVVNQIGATVDAGVSPHGGTPVSTTINVTSNGAVIAGCCCDTDIGGFNVGWATWTGVTEDYDGNQEINAFTISGGFATNLATETPRSISVALSASNGGSRCLVVVSFTGNS